MVDSIARLHRHLQLGLRFKSSQRDAKGLLVYLAMCLEEGFKEQRTATQALL